MKSIEIIDRLRATSSKIDKEQILINAFMTGNREYFQAAKLALDALVSFGVKMVPEVLEDDGLPGTFSFADFIDLAGKLQARQLTGHAARDALIAAANVCHTDTWNKFYRPVLLKDMSVGAERNTFNKILNRLGDAYPEALDYIIPVFGVQLAKDALDEAHQKKVSGIKMIDFKFDGWRFATFLDIEKMTVTQWSRTGIENTNFTHIRAGLEKLLSHLPMSIVLDGEIVSDTFQEMMTMASKKSDPDTEDAKLALFDVVPLADFLAGECAIPQFERHERLCELQTSGVLKEFCGDRVYVVPKITLDLDTEAGMAEMNNLRAKAAELKLEGIMIKDPKAGYVGKKGTNWLKLKPKISVDLTALSVVEGDKKNVGKMGAVICEGLHEDKLVRVSLGGGWTDAQRDEIWQNPMLVIGQVLEIEADCLSKPTKGDIWSLRFPVFLRFRSITRTPGEKD